MITARYGSDEFRLLLDEVAEAVDREAHPCIIFVDGTGAAKQSALTALADHTSLDLYRRDATGLVGERPLQTQGNLREAFDTMVDVPNILAFEHADAVFEASERKDEVVEPDAHTSTDYLYERIEHKPGVTVLELSEPRYVAQAEEVAFAVVKF